MTAKELRKKYLEYFKEKGHTVLPSASLIPEHDPTVLFTTAGMHPLVPFLLGEKHPGGKRLANVQKCVRTGDIDEVGDNWHLTFFEMLGNWSLGDYFKKEAIEMSWEFLTEKRWLGLDPNKIAVSVFAGDSDAPFDEEAYSLWRKIGIPEARIAKLPKEDNWWGPAGETGPCGPDTEIFYWSGKGEAPEKFDPKDKRWPEIWNNVFMEYEKRRKVISSSTEVKQSTSNSSSDPRINADSSADLRGIEYEYVPLKQKNIDTGMGLERTVAILQGKESVYETELFLPIIKKIIEMAGLSAGGENEFYVSNQRAIRIIADHLKAATFILGDQIGVVPSNLRQGYVLRRLIRRAIRYAKMIGIDIKKEFTTAVAQLVVEMYKDVYPELKKNENRILSELSLEEKRFEKTLELGLKEFNKMLKDGKISGKEAFILFSTYGFPLEMTRELAIEKGLKIDEKEFRDEFKKHQELSRTASAGQFKGGLADAGEATKKLHTATHLLHAALRQVLGSHVEQRGSNITPERLRFDFSHPKKMTPEEIKKVEDLVNEQIRKALPVSFEEMTLEEAKKVGAIGLFEKKYGEKVKVYVIGNFSKEICGGPHVKNTKELGHFKIKKEESSSAGVRRIKAVLAEDEIH